MNNYDVELYHEDLMGVQNMILRSTQDSECDCHSSIIANELTGQFNLGFVFSNLHMAAHIAFDRLDLEFSYDDELNQDMLELVATYVAVLLCKRYFDIKHMTGPMAGAIVAGMMKVMSDCKFHKLDYAGEVQEDVFTAVNLVFTDMLQAELAVMQ